jgi:hypothetical protein
MKMLSRLIATAVAASAVVVASAGAAATLVAPSPGSSMTTTHPIFSWTLPAGETGESISVGRSSKINPATGDFPLADLADSDIIDAAVSKWTPERPMSAGKYYWHVASRSETEKHVFSAISSFVIRPSIKLQSIAVKTYGLSRQFLITTSWQANIRTVNFVARLMAGSKQLGIKKLKTDNFLIDARKLDLSTWTIPPTVKKGTRLRFVVTLTAAGGAKATATKTLKAP